MSGGNNGKVLLDLNFPPFLDDLLALEAPDVKKILKTLKKLKSLTWNEVFRDKASHWEDVKTLSGKYTIRNVRMFMCYVTFIPIYRLRMSATQRLRLWFSALGCRQTFIARCMGATLGYDDNVACTRQRARQAVTSVKGRKR